MAETNFKFSKNESIINYDLTPNDISAQEIADASNGVLKTYIPMKGGKKYHLPNTTLYCTLLRDNAKTSFINAFHSTGSRATVNRLFITELNEQIAYIKDEK